MDNQNAVSPSMVLQSMAKFHAECFVRVKGRMPSTPEEFVLWLGEYDSELWKLLGGMENTINEYVSKNPPPLVVNFNAVEMKKKNAVLREALPFISHLGTCPYGDDSPDGDFCTCRVQSVIRKINETLAGRTEP